MRDRACTGNELEENRGICHNHTHIFSYSMSFYFCLFHKFVTFSNVLRFTIFRWYLTSDIWRCMIWYIKWISSQNLWGGSKNMTCTYREPGCWEPAVSSLLNGPLRAQSKADAEYSATWRHTSVAGNMMVFRREQASDPEARWHRGIS